MIRVVTLLLCLSSLRGNLLLKGRLQGVELTITSGESTYALGALPEITYSPGKVVIDFGDFSSSMPPFLKRKVKLVIGPEYNNLILDITAEFSVVRILMDHPCDTLFMDVSSKFSRLFVNCSTVSQCIIKGSFLNGKMEIGGDMDKVTVKLSALGSTIVIKEGYKTGNFEFSSEASNIFLPAGRHIIQTDGFFNRREFVGPHQRSFKSLVKLTGNFNKIFVEGE
ncbi:MAG: hypothetical protein ACPLN0_07605 [Candidatus Hydrothermia bacterium]